MSLTLWRPLDLLCGGHREPPAPRDVVIADAEQRLQLFYSVAQCIGFDFRDMAPYSSPCRP